MHTAETKILGEGDIKPTSVCILIVKSMRGSDHAFSMADLEMNFMHTSIAIIAKNRFAWKIFPFLKSCCLCI